MKKTLAFVLSLAAAMAMAACSSTPDTLVDGSYTAEMSDTYATEVGHGYKPTLTITVSGGEVTDVVLDAVNLETGELKSATTQETYPMDPHPSEWLPQLSENILNAENGDGVEAVAGATTASTEAKVLYDAVLGAAAEGNTETVVLDSVE